jgi:hypothetical protein
MRFIFGIVPALLLALFLSLALSGCSTLGKIGGKKKIKPKAETARTEMIGVIEMVNPEQNYVLIRCDLPPAFSAGTQLVSVDALGAESKLVVTPERKGTYLTADVKSGSPKVADPVLRKHAGEGPKPPPAVTPPAKPTIATPTLPAEPPLPQGGPNNSAPATPTLEPVVR